MARLTGQRPSASPTGGAAAPSEANASEAAVEECMHDLQFALPLLMEVLQNVGDIFSGEEIANSMSQDLAKTPDRHDVLEQEVEVYSRLRKLVRLDRFAEPEHVQHTMMVLSNEMAITVLDSLVRSLATPNPGGEPVNVEAKRQLIFYCNSLHNRRLCGPPPIMKMKSFTSFTPYYSEDVTYSENDLGQKENANSQKSARAKDDPMSEITEGDDEDSLLNLLKALFPGEWDNFLERVEMDTATLRVGQYPIEELQRWASDRAQVLSRTIRGIMRFGDALRILGRLEGVDEEDLEWLVAHKFEYVVSCQVYGKQRRATSGPDVQKADAIDQLRRQYADNLRIAFVDDKEAEPQENPHFSSVLLGVDDEGTDACLYKVRLPGNPILGEGKPENQNHAIIFAHGEFLQTLDMNQDNYLGESFKMRNLLELFRGDVRIVGFPEHIFSFSGGAVAHFSASNETVFGSTVQRFLTWPLMVRFHYGHPDVWDKVWALSCGGVAKASKTLHVSEDIFGGFNVVLRGGNVDYAEFIHCGKGRDMSFIAVNGFETKISAGAAVTTVSRDMLRLMRCFDIFRLMSFYASMAGFYVTTLMSMWSVYLFVLTNVILAIMRMESYDQFEYAEVESTLNTTLCPDGTNRVYRRALKGIIALAVELQNNTQSDVDPCAEESKPDDFFKVDWRSILGLAVADESQTVSSTVGAGAADGSIQAEKQITQRYAMATYNTAQFLHLGMLMMFPLFLEQSVQRSIFFAAKEAVRMFLSFSSFFYPFSMQTRGHNFGFAVNYGRAGYVATGRGYAISTSSMVTLYSAYGPSHIYLGAEIATMLVLYELWKAEGKDFLSTWSVWSVAVSLLLSPWLFNPQSLHRSTLWTSWVEWTHWLYGNGNLKAGRGNWRKWAAFRLQAKRNTGGLLKLQLVARNVSTKLIAIGACAKGLEFQAAYSNVVWHGIFMVRACGIVLVASVYIAVAIKMFEAMMVRWQRTKFLPVYVHLLLTAAYFSIAVLFYLFEHGTWESFEAFFGYGLGNVPYYGMRNTWLQMIAAMAAQAAVVQALGALADRFRYETRLTMSLVGELDELRESRLKECIARQLRGVAATDIRLTASASELQESDLAAKASAFTSNFQSREQKFRDRLLQKVGASRVLVTEVTATIVTTHVERSKEALIILQNHDARSFAAMIAEALGNSIMLQSISAEQTVDIRKTGARRRLLAYAQFWQRITDQTIALLIFTALLALSILPILYVQTTILFNRAFAVILERKIHKQELLDDLYTPGLFLKVEADPSDDQAAPAMTRARRVSMAACRAVGGAFSPGPRRGPARASPAAKANAAGVITETRKPPTTLRL